MAQSSPRPNNQPLLDIIAAAYRRYNTTSLYPPRFLFPIRWSCGSVRRRRYINPRNPREVAVFIAGACCGFRTRAARAGFGIDCGPSEHIRRSLSGPDPHPPNARRAGIMAAIAALDAVDWLGEGFDTLVIASASQYLIQGICHELPRWLQNGWTNSRGYAVVFRHQWQALIVRLLYWHRRGMVFRFWHIRREWNTTANTLAVEAANM